MTTGTVRVFGANGYGFIAPDDGSPEASVQIRNVVAALPLQPGQRVSFESESGLMGPRALSVRPIDSPA